MAGRYSVEGILKVNDRMTRPIRRIESRLYRFTRGASSAFRDLGVMAGRLRTGFLAAAAAVTAAAAAAGLGLKEMIELGMDFEQTITSAAAKFPGRIRRGSEAFAQLEEAAKRVGRETEFTASQAAEGIDYLAMAGFNAEQSIAALPGVVDLATSASLELGQATDIATDSLGAFNLMSTDAAELSANLTRVNDVLAKVNATENTTIPMMFEAITTGAPATMAAAQSVETFSAMVGKLAFAGIKGSEAGTAIRNMMIRLQAPAASGRRALQRLGVSVLDNEGNMRDMFDILEDLNRATAEMGTGDRTKMMNDIFGARAITSANILLQVGSDKLREYRTTLEGASGAAAEMAATMRDTTRGDLNGMNSAIEGLKIEIFTLVSGPLRDLIQSITEWVRANQGDITEGLRTGVAWLTEHMPTIVLWAGRIGKALAALGVLIGIAIAPAVALFAVVYTAATAALIGIVEGGIWLWDVFRGIWDGIVEFAGGAWERIKEFVAAAVEFHVGFFTIIARAVGTVLGPALDWFAGAAAWVMEKWAPIGAWFGELWAGIASAFTSVWNGIMGEASSYFDAIKEIWAPIGAFFSDLWAGIVDGFVAAFGWVIEQIGATVAHVRGVGREAMGDDGEGGSAGPAPQIVSPQERTARTITESTSTERSEVTIRDESGRAEVTRQPRGARSTIRLEPSGAM